MSLAEDPKCREIISVAEVCPHCGGKKKKAPMLTFFRFFWGALVFFVLVFVLVWMSDAIKRRFGKTSEERAEQEMAQQAPKELTEEERDKAHADARSLCRFAALQSIDHLDSAVMEPKESYFLTKLENGSYYVRVRGHVKRKSNALQPTSFNCYVRPYGDDGTWQLISIRQFAD